VAETEKTGRGNRSQTWKHAAMLAWLIENKGLNPNGSQLDALCSAFANRAEWRRTDTYRNLLSDHKETAETARAEAQAARKAERDAAKAKEAAATATTTATPAKATRASKRAAKEAAAAAPATPAKATRKRAAAAAPSTEDNPFG